MDLEEEIRVLAGDTSDEHFRRNTKLLGTVAENIIKALTAYRRNISSGTTGSSSVPFSIPADPNYQALLDIALRHANTTLQVALSQTQVFSSVVGSITIMKEFLQFLSADIEKAVFRRAPNEPQRELIRYISIGQQISDTIEIKEFNDQLEDINKLKESDEYGPFVFVCAPSGTGKTNAAFAISRPFLYFVHNPTITSRTQGIYNCFNEQSLHLQKFVEEDFAQYTNSEDESRLKDEQFIIDTITDCGMKFRTVGFLVAMIRNVVERWIESNKQLHPSIIQVLTTEVIYEPMTLAEAREQLHTLPLDKVKSAKDGHQNYVIPVFIDEYDLRNTKLVAFEYNMLRNIMRGMRITPIFMGTNADASNFLLTYGGPGSRNTEQPLWCLLWHRLPSLSQEYLDDSLRSFRHIALEWRARDERRMFPSENALAFIASYFTKERPLFYRYAEDFMMHMLTVSDPPQSDREFLEALFEEILGHFRYEKGCDSSFNNGQVAYMSSIVWEGKSTDGSLVPCKEVLNTNLYIHGHMAYLDAIPHSPQAPFYSRVVVKGRKYTRVYQNSLAVVRLHSLYEPFEKSPLTGLIVTGLRSGNSSAVLSTEREESSSNQALPLIPALGRYKSSSTRASVVKVLGQHAMAGEELAIKQKSKSSGYILELALLCASIIASHAEGTNGCGLFTFLSHFLRELDADATYFVNPLQTVTFDPRFVEMFGTVRIPFLAPMGTSGWDPEFAAMLAAAVGEVYLGIAYPSLKDARADMEVYNWVASDPTPPPGQKPNRSPLLVAQAKLYKRNIDKTIFVDKIFPSFAEFSSCKLFIVVAPGFAKMKDIVHEDYCLWTFVESSSGASMLKQVLVNPLQSPSKSKHVLLCTLKCSVQVRRDLQAA